jgi:hypothetical protein
VQLGQTRDQLGAGGHRDVARLVLQPEPRLALDQGAVGDEVEDIVLVAQGPDQAVEGVGPGDARHRDLAQTAPRPLQLAGDVDGRQGPTPRPVGVDRGGVGDDDQGAEVGPGAELDRTPVVAAQVAREQDGLARQEPFAGVGIAQQLPLQAVQLRGAGADEQADPQRQLRRIHADLAELRLQIGIGE